jgi:peptide/nickel transport system permease protein
MKTGWFLRRLLHAGALLFAVSILSFLMGRFAPGGFFDDLRLNPQLSPETVSRLRARYGLGASLPVQYGKWVTSAVRGDFGTSLAWQQPVAPVLAPRIRNTLQLTGAALIGAWVIGLPLGMLAGSRRKSLVDRAGSLLTAVLLAIPELLLLLILMYSAVAFGRFWLLRSFLLPLTVLVAGAAPAIFLHARAATEEVLRSGFIRSARAHGIRGLQLWLRFVLPASANPLISLFGLSIGGLIGASLVVETVLSRPGLGPLFLEAIASRDLDVVTAVMLLSAAFLVVGNLLADLALAWNDPRLRDEDSLV